MYTLFLDIETTSLPPRKTRPELFNKYNSCRILQVALQVCNINRDVIDSLCAIIKPREEYTIDPYALSKHKITKEIIAEKGGDIRTIVDFLSKYREKIDLIVSHNIEFDINILLSELYRYKYIELADIYQAKKRYCTMLKSKAIFNLVKYPKLIELCQKFGIVYDESLLHDASIDTELCKQCYYKLLDI